MDPVLEKFYQNILNLELAQDTPNDSEEDKIEIKDSEDSTEPETHEEKSLSGTYQLPIKGGEYKRFGGYYTEKTSHHPKGHEALDIFAPGTTAAVDAKQMSTAMKLGLDESVFPIGSGRVVQVGSGAVSGNFCVIQHPQDPGMYSFYAHLNKVNVSKGAKVSSGTTIGLNGNTGSAKKTAPHVHLEIWIIEGSTSNPVNAPKRKINPESVIGKSYGSINKEASNKIQNILKASSLFHNLVKNNHQ